MRKSTVRTLATVILAAAALHIFRTEQARVAALAAIPVTPTVTPRPTHTPPSPPPGPSPTPTPHLSAVAKMETAVDEFCRLKSFSGAVLVMRDGQVILERAGGLADRGRETPNTVDTRFLVGSLATEFTAVAVLLLEQEGRLALSDPLCRYLPDCPAACLECTIEDLLLVQATGADRSPANPTYSDVHGVHVGYPGRASHSPDVVSIAATVIKLASSMPYGDYLETRVFAPLGMKDTGFDGSIGPTAIGYAGAQSAPIQSLTADSASALYTTVDDLRRWDSALTENQLLGPIAVSRLFAPHRLTDTAISACLAALATPRLADAKRPSSGDGLGQSLGGTVLLEDGHHLVRAEGAPPGSGPPPALRQGRGHHHYPEQPAGFHRHRLWP